MIKFRHMKKLLPSELPTTKLLFNIQQKFLKVSESKSAKPKDRLGLNGPLDGGFHHLGEGVMVVKQCI